MRAIASSSLLGCLVIAGCGSPSTPAQDAGRDASVAIDAAPLDAITLDAPPAVDVGTDAPRADGGPDAGPCERPVGERYPIGDACNFCECNADGTRTCTDRVCTGGAGGGCMYAGTMHDYAERFPSSDGCNECVCAASGLACTARASCTDVPDSAILLESPTDPCGTDSSFTPASVLDGLPTTDFVAPFLYDRGRDVMLYPESLPDTNVRIRISYDDGFLVCRIPDPSQPALDIEVRMEWITEDGAFDEGFHTYLRKNGFGFVDAWQLVASAPLGGLHGTYTPNCALDPGGYSFDAQIEPNGHASGAAHRVCETDLPLTIASFERPAD